MFQKPAACFKIIPRRLKINGGCDEDGCSCRLPSEILMSSDSVLDSKLSQNGKKQDKSQLSLNENLKKALFSNQSFCSTALTNGFLFTPLLKEISRQTGHMPIPLFNKDYSILNVTPMLTYDTAKKKKKNLISQKKTAARQGQTETGVVFCTSAHSFCFSREGGVMWPCSHLITPVGASNGHIPVAVPTWPPSLFCLVIPQAH